MWSMSSRRSGQLVHLHVLSYRCQEILLALLGTSQVGHLLLELQPFRLVLVGEGRKPLIADLALGVLLENGGVELCHLLHPGFGPVQLVFQTVLLLKDLCAGLLGQQVGKVSLIVPKKIRHPP